jgi:hypothetical protein
MTVSTGFPLPDLVGSSTGAYYFNLIVAASCLLLMYMIVNSPFGRIFQGIRDNPERCQAVGVNVQKQQLVGQTIAAFFAGVAGTLFVTVEGSVFPDLMFWTLSLEILIMCLLGGWFIFLGPALGAAIIISLRTFAGIYTEYWTLILGIVLMLLIFFLPEGVLGLFLKSRSGRKKGKVDAACRIHRRNPLMDSWRSTAPRSRSKGGCGCRDRAQRRRQDHLVQPDHRPVVTHRRQRSGSRKRISPAWRPSRLPQRDQPVLPGGQYLPPLDCI